MIHSAVTLSGKQEQKGRYTGHFRVSAFVICNGIRSKGVYRNNLIHTFEFLFFAKANYLESKALSLSNCLPLEAVNFSRSSSIVRFFFSSPETS